ncbi:MAG: hypothetical protein AB1736_00530 [Chloroflexota bacterium]
MHFYELHEGDDDTFFDVLLFREDEMDPDEFYTVVQSIRRRIQDTHEADTLVEAIAEELEQDYGFVYLSDDRLTAAVNVSKVEEDNFLADLEPEALDDDEEIDYASVYADLEPTDRSLN